VVAGVTIPYSSEICDLGMTLNDRVTFDDHLNVQGNTTTCKICGLPLSISLLVNSS
jgi:hypothetical protein